MKGFGFLEVAQDGWPTLIFVCVWNSAVLALWALGITCGILGAFRVLG